MKKTVYIAGKIKGLPTHEVREKFANAEKLLSDAGYKCFNPFAYIEEENRFRVRICLQPLRDDNTAERQMILRICTRELTKCHNIYFLPDWSDSEGSIYEKTVAEKTGITEVELPKVTKQEETLAQQWVNQLTEAGYTADDMVSFFKEAVRHFKSYKERKLKLKTS